MKHICWVLLLAAWTEPKPTMDSRYVAAVKKAAHDYLAWHRVDEWPNIAPDLCRAPSGTDFGKPSEARLSAADDGPHAKKLYYLWASDRGLYVDAKRDIPVGFSIVKESFAAKPSKAPPSSIFAKPGWRLEMGYLPPIRWAKTASGDWLETGERKDLYVMTKVGDQPGADDGWIYGTVAPDGTVTSAGRVATCMGCHDEAATRERLFGLAQVSPHQ